MLNKKICILEKFIKKLLKNKTIDMSNGKIFYIAYIFFAITKIRKVLIMNKEGNWKKRMPISLCSSI